MGHAVMLKEVFYLNVKLRQRMGLDGVHLLNSHVLMGHFMLTLHHKG